MVQHHLDRSLSILLHQGHHDGYCCAYPVLGSLLRVLQFSCICAYLGMFIYSLRLILLTYLDPRYRRLRRLSCNVLLDPVLLSTQS